jgi:hypothetical protein
MKEPEDRDEDERDDYQDEDTRRCIVCEKLIHSGLTCGGCEQENAGAMAGEGLPSASGSLPNDPEPQS